MFIFILNKIDGLVHAISVIGCLGDTFDLKFAPEMLSIMAKASRTCPFIVALQMFPPFFNEYLCYELQYSWIDIDSFYPIMFDLHRSGFCSLTFSFAVPFHADLTFEGPNRRMREADFPLNPADDLRDVGEFDWGTFVSIQSQQFITIVTSLYNFDYVLVTLTSSQVKFTCSRTEIILTQQRRQCIVGGVAPTNGVHFVVTLHPMVTLCDMARQSQRIWLFKSCNSSKGVISAPLGLHARFLAYFPDRIPDII